MLLGRKLTTVSHFRLGMLGHAGMYLLPVFSGSWWLILGFLTALSFGMLTSHL
jgi:hypothetical protein